MSERRKFEKDTFFSEIEYIYSTLLWEKDGMIGMRDLP